MANKKQSFFYKNSLSIVFITLFVLAMIAQAFFGWQDHNQDLSDLGASGFGFLPYLTKIAVEA